MKMVFWQAMSVFVRLFEKRCYKPKDHVFKKVNKKKKKMISESMFDSLCSDFLIFCKKSGNQQLEKWEYKNNQNQKWLQYNKFERIIDSSNNHNNNLQSKDGLDQNEEEIEFVEENEEDENSIHSNHQNTKIHLYDLHIVYSYSFKGKCEKKKQYFFQLFFKLDKISSKNSSCSLFQCL